ncbi:hypothetical protein [Pseudovibrio brasiliensis]|uniref:Uncharacterized protein n=1 Tax=Pseudovibrio brasiliensis TaxID=1898042 RepID=A0ABX8AN39_9HYPH|nr:hypothetical protein [Pseudovibrio brasiliensis]QUS56052.1 hypothetical protein KGB56_00790 [Pseudovibrio brasiliensis]
MKVKIASAFLGLSLASSPLAYADEAPDKKWSAVSTTAMSITGDVVVGMTSITMETGSVLHIKPVQSSVPNLYRFTGADMLMLIRDNKFCLPATTDGYLVLSYPGKNMLAIDVFDGDMPPTAVDNMESQSNFCASYNYEMPG